MNKTEQLLFKFVYNLDGSHINNFCTRHPWIAQLLASILSRTLDQEIELTELTPNQLDEILAEYIHVTAPQPSTQVQTQEAIELDILKVIQ